MAFSLQIPLKCDLLFQVPHTLSRITVQGWYYKPLHSFLLGLSSKTKVYCLLGASVRNSPHGKGHEEGGLAYTKAWSSLRKPPVPEHLPPKPESICFTVSHSHLHLWLYGGLFPTSSLREGVNVQLQVNKNSWVWQECFSLRTPLKVI